MSNTVPQGDNAPDRSDHEDVHVAPDDADGTAAVGMQEHPDAPVIRGERVERIITTKDFLPPGDPQFTARLGCEPRGTRVLLGTLRGVVNSTERKIKLWNDKELESVWLNGMFEAVMRGTGEIKSAPTAILPKAFGITIENSLQGLDAGDKVELTIDCDIGLEATGRAIPYEWIIVYYREGKAFKALRDVRARSEARLAREARRLISGPVNGA